MKEQNFGPLEILATVSRADLGKNRSGDSDFASTIIFNKKPQQPQQESWHPSTVKITKQPHYSDSLQGKFTTIVSATRASIDSRNRLPAGIIPTLKRKRTSFEDFEDQHFQFADKEGLNTSRYSSVTFAPNVMIHKLTPESIGSTNTSKENDIIVQKFEPKTIVKPPGRYVKSPSKTLKNFAEPSFKNAYDIALFDNSQMFIEKDIRPSSTGYPNPSFDRILQFFEQRHIFLNIEWLQSLLEYLDSIEGLNLGDYNRLIYSQWLNADMRESSEGKFERPSNKYYDKPTIFQVIKKKDVTNALHERMKKQNEEIEVPKRSFIMLLTDGKTEVQALEHEFIEKLANPNVGFKIFITSPVRFKDGVLLLNPRNCRVLGGCITSL